MTQSQLGPHNPNFMFEMNKINETQEIERTVKTEVSWIADYEYLTKIFNVAPI